MEKGLEKSHFQSKIFPEWLCPLHLIQTYYLSTAVEIFFSKLKESNNYDQLYGDNSQIYHLLQASSQILTTLSSGSDTYSKLKAHLVTLFGS